VKSSNSNSGYRGYLSSRPFSGERVPQHVQNIVIRDYCVRNNLKYLLSATEVAMPNSYLMLNKLLSELTNIDGIVCYSLFQLPEEKLVRRNVCEEILIQKKTIHFAVESLRVDDWSQVAVLESICDVKRVIGHCLSKQQLIDTMQ